MLINETEYQQQFSKIINNRLSTRSSSPNKTFGKSNATADNTTTTLSRRDYTTRPTADHDIDGEHLAVITNRYLTSAGARRHNKRPSTSPINASTDADSMMRSTMKTDYRTPPKQIYNNQHYSMHQKSSTLGDNILQGAGSFETRTTHRDDYRGAMSADRSIAIRPIGSDVLKGVGQMQSSTINRDEYTAKNGDRYKLIKPIDCDNILNGDRILRNTETQHRHDFQNGTKQGERYKLEKRKDSDVFKGDGRFVDETQYRHDFRKTDKQQRTKPIRPTTSDALKGNGAMQQMTTTSRQDYQANAGAERSIAIRPVESNLLKSNGAFESTSVYGEDYRDAAGKGERYELVKPKDTDVLMIKGDSSRLIGTTQHQADYQTPQERGGKRFDMKRPMPSNILKGEGTMQSSTVSREEYQRKAVDKSTARRPVDSDILKMDGKFATLTMYKDHYRRNNNSHRPSSS